MRRTLLLVALALALLAGVAACGGDDDAAPSSTTGTECRAAVEGRVEIVAKALAWDVACLSMPSDQPVVIEVDNQDSGVNHNLRVQGVPDEPATALEAGPVQQELEVELPEGEYGYVCDIHPNMVGTIRSAPGGDVTPPQ